MRAALVGRGEGRRHAARVERDRRRHPRRRPRRRGRDQPESRLRRSRPADRARGERGGGAGVARRRSIRERRRRRGARSGTRPRSRTSRPSPRPTGRGTLRRSRAGRRYVDLAAPGDDIIVASALGKNWRPASGTSFSSPMVAAAAAWVWTARPGAHRRHRWPRSSGARRGTSRRAGVTRASGFGMLNVAAALALPAPIRDPYEPNDDVDEVDPNGDRLRSKAPVAHDPTRRTTRVSGGSTPTRIRATSTGSGSRRRAVAATLTTSSDGDLALYSGLAPSVIGRSATTGRLADGDDRGRGSGSRTATRSGDAGRTSSSDPRRDARRDVRAPGHERRHEALTVAVATTAACSTGRLSTTSLPDAERTPSTGSGRRARPRARRRTPRAGGTPGRPRSPSRSRRRRGSRARPRCGRAAAVVSARSSSTSIRNRCPLAARAPARRGTRGARYRGARSSRR